MNPNPTIDNDLQKAIDDITNNTNSVFGEPIAEPAPAPAPAPEPAPAPAPRPAPAPEPIAPVPDFEPAPAPAMDVLPPAPEPAEPAAPEAPEAPEAPAAPEMQSVKEAVLRDLAPRVDKINASPSEKFSIYKDIREELGDNSVIASAYEVSKEITDEDERTDALLYLYDSLK